jgi:hypothetical protein
MIIECLKDYKKIKENFNELDEVITKDELLKATRKLK